MDNQAQAQLKIINAVVERYKREPDVVRYQARELALQTANTTRDPAEKALNQIFYNRFLEVERLRQPDAEFEATAPAPAQKTGPEFSFRTGTAAGMQIAGVLAPIAGIGVCGYVLVNLLAAVVPLIVVFGVDALKIAVVGFIGIFAIKSFLHKDTEQAPGPGHYEEGEEETITTRTWKKRWR